MMGAAPAFTTTEAAYVLRAPVKAVRKALDAGPVEPQLVAKPGGAVRAVGFDDLVFLVAERSLRHELTPKARRDLYRALKRAPVEQVDTVRFGQVTVEIAPFRAEVETRARDLAELAEKVAFRDDGEPVLRDGGVEVHRLAALSSSGVSVEDIATDYPSLSADQIRDALAYAAAYPKAGRPYPAISLKRALAGAGFEALDAVLDTAADV